MNRAFTFMDDLDSVETICALKERATRLENRAAEIQATSTEKPHTVRNQAHALIERARVCRNTAKRIESP